MKQSFIYRIYKSYTHQQPNEQETKAKPMKEELKHFLKILKELQSINTEFPLQYVICLAHIALNEGLCMTDLAERTGMALSTVSRITTALAKTGGSYELIKIEIAPDEKRRKHIFLNENGKKTINKLTKNLVKQ